MRVASAVAAVVAVGCLVSPAPGSTTSIGVFFDAGATDCDHTTQPLTPFSVYVVAILGADAAADGITGAGFRVDGLADIVFAVTPNPAASVAIGDPTDVAAYIAFGSCVPGDRPQNGVPLYTIVCLPFGTVSPRVVSVLRPATPCDACNYWAPFVTICDASSTRVFVGSGEARINSGACTVSTRPFTWSGVKAMFRG